MMPNKEVQKDDEHNVLFQCECHGHHFLEVGYDLYEWMDGENNIDDLWLEFLDYPNSLWAAVKWWWKQHKVWTSECLLNLDDVVELRDTLSGYIEKRTVREKEKYEHALVMVKELLDNEPDRESGDGKKLRGLCAFINDYEQRNNIKK